MVGTQSCTIWKEKGSNLAFSIIFTLENITNSKKKNLYLCQISVQYFIKKNIITNKLLF